MNIRLIYDKSFTVFLHDERCTEGKQAFTYTVVSTHVEHLKTHMKTTVEYIINTYDKQLWEEYEHPIDI